MASTPPETRGGDHVAEIVDRVIVMTGRNATEPQSRAADLLRRRILARSRVSIQIISEGEDLPWEDGAIVLVGRLESNDLLRSLAGEMGLNLPRLPDTDRLHPEGFAIVTALVDQQPYVLIVGADDRGVIYGIGAFLRSLIYHANGVSIPFLFLADKPALQYRGTVALSVGPNPLATKLANVRPQTEEEVLTGIEDMILLGANLLRGMEDIAAAHGISSYSSFNANAMPGSFPEEWGASPSSSLHIKVNQYFRERFACPSVPEARRALLHHFEALVKEREFDIISMKSGDVAGCTCERCMPWGGTFIRLVHEMWEILHGIRPQAKLMVTSQNVTDEGNEAILDYLDEHDTGWVWALHYAPGGNEMSTYNRPPINPKWFEYEGFGWSNYLKYLHHRVPARTNILLYSDVTHWIRSQYGVDHPDVSLAAIYNRRAWNARPVHYGKVAREIFRYALGDLFYSEGIHDDFNKWFWYRMLWNPNLHAEEITREYCRYWFGPEAEEEMTEAIFLMEETLERPVLGNPAIRRAVQLLRSARSRIPANLMEIDYRWHVIMQKALLDLYIQLWLERGEELKGEAFSKLEEALTSGQLAQRLQDAISILRRPQETERMSRIREETREFGERSNQVIGYREPAYFNLREFDITEIGWCVERLREALSTQDEDAMRNTAAMILRYEDPGEGGFYERVGWPSERTHLLEHQNILGYFPFTGPARHHHYASGYSWSRQDAVMVLEYDGLDASARYVVRVGVGFHCDSLEDFLDRTVKGGALVQSLEINGTILEPELPLPLGEIQLHEFEIPPGLTREGKAKVVLRARNEEFPVAGLNAIWLMRKDKMPWRVNPA